MTNRSRGMPGPSPDQSMMKPSMNSPAAKAPITNRTFRTSTTVRIGGRSRDSLAQPFQQADHRRDDGDGEQRGRQPGAADDHERRQDGPQQGRAGLHLPAVQGGDFS